MYKKLFLENKVKIIHILEQENKDKKKKESEEILSHYYFPQISEKFTK
jgi:hypothetical protein